MRNALSEFVSNCRELFRGEQNDHKSPEQLSFERSYQKQLQCVKQHPESVAYNYASDWEDEKARWRRSDIYEDLEKQGFKRHNCIRHEMVRRLRAEQFIEMEKSYRQIAGERCPQKDEPDLGRD